MTLERHRSKLIPDVDFSGDGAIFVTDTEGTFPLRHGKKSRDPIPQDIRDKRAAAAPGEPPPDYDTRSYLSYDPKRDTKRLYKPQQRTSRFAEEVNKMTWGSSGSQSLQRKLRRLRGKGSIDGDEPTANGDTNHRISRIGTWSSAGKDKRRKKSDEFPRMDAGYTTASMQRHRRGSTGARSLDIDAIKAYKERMSDRKSTILEMYKTNSGLPLIQEQPSAKARRLADERLPGKLFLVCGLLLLALGATKLLVCWWHEYFCLIWTGFFLLCLGISGTSHRGDYFTKWPNAVYISLGLISSLAVMASCGLLLQVITPTIIELSMHTSGTEIAQEKVSFSNMYKSLAIQIPMDDMVWLNLGLDLASLVLCLINFFSLTGTMVAVGNHWDAVYKTTGECDHRGHPRTFNPFLQISVGQGTLFLGIIVITLWQSQTYQHMYSPVWSAFAVPFAGAMTMFYGKRPDSQCLAVTALFLQPMSMAFLTVSSVLVLLGILDDIDLIISEQESPAYEQRLASIVAECMYILGVIVNLIFVIGIVFRICRQICCPRCLDPPSKPLSKSGSKPPSIG